MMMPSIIFRRLTDLPKFFWRYPMSYISYTAWSIQVQMSVHIFSKLFPMEILIDSCHLSFALHLLYQHGVLKEGKRFSVSQERPILRIYRY